MVTVTNSTSHDLTSDFALYLHGYSDKLHITSSYLHISTVTVICSARHDLTSDLTSCFNGTDQSKMLIIVVCGILCLSDACHVALDRNPGLGYNTLLFQLIS